MINIILTTLPVPSLQLEFSGDPSSRMGQKVELFAKFCFVRPAYSSRSPRSAAKFFEFSAAKSFARDD